MFQPGMIIDLGPVNIPITILGMAASFLVGYLLIRLQESKGQPPVKANQRLSESFLNLLLAGILLYKVWPIILNPSLIWTRGWSVIYFSGGSYYQIGLALLILGWFVWNRHKHQIPWDTAGQMLIRGLMPSLVVWFIMIREYGVAANVPIGFEYQGQIYHPVNFYFAAYLIVILVMMLYRQRRPYPLEPWGLLLISFFYIIIDPIRAVQEVFIVFDGIQWAWITAVLSIVWIIFSHRQADHRQRAD